MNLLHSIDMRCRLCGGIGVVFVCFVPEKDRIKIFVYGHRMMITTHSNFF